MHKIPSPPGDLGRLYRHGDRAAWGPGIKLDFSVSVNPYGPPPMVAAVLRVVTRPAAIRHRLPVVSHYPDPDCRDLAERLAKRHGVAADRVVVGNGANDLIYATARALRPRRAAIVEPTYTEYLRASLQAGAVVTHWLPEDESLRPAPFDPEGAAVIWLCNPNNPTGRLWPPGTLQPWIENHPRTVFVVDEAFLPFREDEAEHTVIPAADRLANVVVLRSLTKFYTLPGLRLGYAVAGPDLAGRLREQVVPWSVNGFAQVVGAAALRDGAFRARTWPCLRAALECFTAGLARCSSCLKPLPTEANFILLRLKGVTAAWLCGRLAERGIAVRDASNFVGLDEHYVRVSLRRPRDNERLLRELRLLFLEG